MTKESSGTKTIDCGTIRRWVEDRGGKPARVRGTGDDIDAGVLRVAFNDDEKLEAIHWDEFFDKFEAQNLAFLYQDEAADGAASRFFKLVDRDA